MEPEIISQNPIVKNVIIGNAPRPVCLAAARGVLPISQTDLLEILVHQVKNNDSEIASAARLTLDSQELDNLFTIASSADTAPSILHYMAENKNLPREIHEAVIVNTKTPDEVILKIASNTTNGALLELIIINQQRLLRSPNILEAILNNHHRSPEAERRSKEIKKEFFEKERGAKQIANELRARGQSAAAEFFEKEEFEEELLIESSEEDLTVEDAMFLADFIEVPDAEIDDSWLSLDLIEEIYEESEEQRRANLNKVVGELKEDDEDAWVDDDRIIFAKRVLKMNMKKRLKYAMKGNREARSILIRDSNRIVAQAVIQNPRITDQEVEKIAAMRTVPEDVLRLISTNRIWAKNYNIMHILVKNPRTPIANIMGILPRMQTKDLAGLSKNRNVSDAVRRQALRLSQARAGR